MSLKQDIEAFSTLGQFLEQFGSNGAKKEVLKELNEEFYDIFLGLINRHVHYNGWFSKQNIQNAIDNLVVGLHSEVLNEWMSNYDLNRTEIGKKVLVVMPSNLPLVEFHDFIAVLLSGHHFVGKCSDQNKQLLPAISGILKKINSNFSNRISFIDRPNKDFDAVIATGSNNSARYFEYYFSKLPNIIRKNRTSIAVLTNEVTDLELKNLAEDITLYFGRGCRSITKLMLPEGFDINKVFEALFDKNNIIDNNKYGNNYDYHRALYLMGQHPFLDNGFAILKEDKSLHSPVSVVHYEYYKSSSEVMNSLNLQKEEIQCIVSNDNTISSLALGEAQSPKWMDYADNVDTVDFLNNLY